MDTIRIRMRKTVRPDFPLGIIGLLGEKPGTILRAGMEYQAISNKNGAISGIKTVQSPACARMENIWGLSQENSSL